MFRGIHDCATDGEGDLCHVIELVESTFRRQGSVLLLQTIQTFDFHREFLAGDYRPPEAPATGVSKPALGGRNDGTPGNV